MGLGTLPSLQQTCPGVRPDNAIHHQTMRALIRPHGCCCARAEDAVDRQRAKSRRFGSTDPLVEPALELYDGHA